MRCVPHAIVFSGSLDTLVRVSKQSSGITHYDPRYRYGCAVLNCTVAGYLEDRRDPLDGALTRVEDDAPSELVESLRVVPDEVSETQLQSIGYVVHTLQTALHDALTAEGPEDAIVRAVNRGNDTDTVGAVTGAIAGARFGASDLPDRWLTQLQYRREPERLARELDGADIEA